MTRRTRKHAPQDIWTQFHDLRHPTTFIAPYTGALRRFWKESIADLPADRSLTVLDIGTGNLPIPRIMLEREELELEIHAIDTANIRSSQIPGDKNVHFHRQSAEQTDFSDNYFDWVTGCFALEYTSVPDTLAELYRIMKPQARAVFVLHHPQSISVRSALADMNQDIPIILNSGIFQAARRFVNKPNRTNRKAVVAILGRVLDKPELRSYWRIDAVVKTVGRHLEAPDPWRYRKWEKSFFLDQKRREALIAAAIEDPEALTSSLGASGFRIDHLGVLEEDDEGSADRPAGEPPREAGILGWTLKISKPEAVE